MDIRKYFDGLTPEQINEGNKRQLENNIRIYENFKAAYKAGKCSLCGQSLTEFNSYKPCFHWFLRPHGIKKKHFIKYLSRPIGFFKFDSYIRWIANLEKPFGNINDLKSEIIPAKIIEYTIKYKNIEWSISIGKTDRAGHINSKNGNFPHFHIQMKINKNSFINFNDFHIPLSDEDIFIFRVLEEAPDKVIWKSTFGQGISIIEDENILDQLESMMSRTDDIANASFSTSTLIQMPEGESIDSDLLRDVFKESKETGVPIRQLLKKQYPNAYILTEIRPGLGVPEISQRTKRK